MLYYTIKISGYTGTILLYSWCSQFSEQLFIIHGILKLLPGTTGGIFGVLGSLTLYVQLKYLGTLKPLPGTTGGMFGVLGS